MYAQISPTGTVISVTQDSHFPTHGTESSLGQTKIPGSGSSFQKAPWKSMCHCHLLQNNSCCLQGTVSLSQAIWSDMSIMASRCTRKNAVLSFLPTKYTPSNVLWRLPTVSGLPAPLLVIWRPLDKAVKLHPALNLGSWKSCKKNEMQWGNETGWER